MWSAFRRASSGVRWYVRELMDESAYERYVTHLRRDHPAAEVPNRRDFERMRTDRQEADPRQGFRCC
ncbi:CstA-like transporter-associated (seleno)protein [Streptomyces hokutonensis]|uniref:CstA-like transporter-associated (seleno)protein n=1 Tax=Streptomyces hokutonensis TaxID=1306990 RepID=UPI0036C7E547